MGKYLARASHEKFAGAVWTPVFAPDGDVSWLELTYDQKEIISTQNSTAGLSHFVGHTVCPLLSLFFPLPINILSRPIL